MWCHGKLPPVPSPAPVGVILLSRVPISFRRARHSGALHGAFSHDSSRVKGKWLGSCPYLSFWGVSGPSKQGQPHPLPRGLDRWALLLPLIMVPTLAAGVHHPHLPPLRPGAGLHFACPFQVRSRSPMASLAPRTMIAMLWGWSWQTLLGAT